jgi:hypothetical protein
MANQDIFKQAIAEAKAVREAAISNAKDVMEESLTPHLKDMLAAKLQEMEAEEMDETVEEEVVEEESVEEGSYDKDEMDEGQGNIDADEDNPHDQLEEEEIAEEEAPVAEEDEPAEDESEESEDEAEAEEGEEEAEEIEDMKIDDLKALIRDIIAQEMGHGEEEGMEDMSMDDEEGGVEDMVSADDEEINLDELLAELEALSEDLDEDLEEEVTEEEVSEESVEEMKHDDEEKMEEEVTEEVEETTVLQEALETVETLRKELSEVNLLNSKLLYVNKIFKANNLSEAQKVNIIATFDKAETVKEVKLVYETVAENITSVKSEKTNLKEHKSFASKATGNSTKGEVISEVSEQVRRMQRLAGIIK